jgi:hypothetical protein
MESTETKSPIVTQNGEGVEVRIAQSLSEVSVLRDAWEKMCVDPNADIDFYRTIVQSRGEVLRPHVIVLKRNGNVHSILAGRLEKKELGVHLGYKKLRLASVRCLTLIHGGLLGKQSQNCAAGLVESVLKSLRNGEADVVWFYGLDVNSDFYRVARKAGGFLTRDYFPGQIQRWKIQLPPTYEKLYQGLSSNTKHNLKRYSKRLRDAFGHQLTTRSFLDVRDLGWVLADTEAIAAKTYHRGLGVGFIDNEETRRTMTLAAERGWLRAHILYVAGKPCAFWNGVLYRGTFFTSTTGYDPAFRDYRPGTFLLQKMLRDLYSEKIADKVDFGFGDAQYKRDWCKQEQLQTSFLLFAPTVKGIYLNCLRTPLIAASNGAQRILTRARVLQRVKRAWRERLAEKTKPGCSAKQSEEAPMPQPVSFSGGSS